MFKYITDRKSEGGFTLVELMVVILIIAILIAVAVPIFLGARTRARDSNARQALVNAARAEAAYYASNSALANAALMAGEESSYSYSDAVVAPAFANPPAIAIDTAAPAYLRTTSESGTVYKIVITGGTVGTISPGN